MNGRHANAAHFLVGQPSSSSHQLFATRCAVPGEDSALACRGFAIPTSGSGLGMKQEYEAAWLASNTPMGQRDAPTLDGLNICHG